VSRRYRILPGSSTENGGDTDDPTGNLETSGPEGARGRESSITRAREFLILWAVVDRNGGYTKRSEEKGGILRLEDSDGLTEKEVQLQSHLTG